MAELTLGMCSWSSMVSRLCTSPYLKGNPCPHGTTGTGRFPWDIGLIKSKEIIDKILEKLSISFHRILVRLPRRYPMVEVYTSEQIKKPLVIKFG